MISNLYKSKLSILLFFILSYFFYYIDIITSIQLFCNINIFINFLLNIIIIQLFS